MWYDMSMKKSRKRNKYKKLLWVLVLPFAFIFLILVYALYSLFRSPSIKESPVEEIKMYYDIDKFVIDEEGWMTFIDPNYEYEKGIDVSRFQHEIDWEQVKESGIDFAILRAGLREAVEGGIWEDSAFEEYVEGALENDIGVGVYWYSTALNEEELDEEIEFLTQILEPYEITYPVVFDMEPYDQEEDGGRISVLSRQEKTDLANLFCDKMESLGYDTMIYGNLNWLYNDLDFSQIANREIWYAAYQSKPAMPDRFTMWQYSNQGIIPGIDTSVDLNIYIKEKVKEDVQEDE